MYAAYNYTVVSAVHLIQPALRLRARQGHLIQQRVLCSAGSHAIKLTAVVTACVMCILDARSQYKPASHTNINYINTEQQCCGARLTNSRLSYDLACFKRPDIRIVSSDER